MATAPEIHGLMLEAGSRQPVYGARILLTKLVGEQLRVRTAVNPAALTAEASTDAAGAFHFAVENDASYELRWEMDGYVSPQSTERTIRVLVKQGANPAPVEFLVSRPGDLSGRVIDRSDSRPVAGLRVLVSQIRNSGGVRMAIPSGSAATNADGAFLVSGLRPGDYVVRPVSHFATSAETKAWGEQASRESALFLTQFTEEDMQPDLVDFESSWWPGGGELDAAFPVTIGASSAASVGDLVLEKRPVHHVVITAMGSGCGANEEVAVDVRRESGSWNGSSSVGQMRCGTKALLRGLPSGSYRLELQVLGKDREHRARGSLAFDVLDRNVEVAVPVTRGVNLEGRMVLAEGAAPMDFSPVRLDLRPVGWVIQMDEADNPVNADGSFRVVNLAAREHLLRVNGVSAPYYVKAIRYGRSELRDSTLPVTADAGQMLEIEIDDRSAVLTGRVTKSGRAVAQAHVLLAKWPVGSGLRMDAVIQRRSDSEGSYRFDGVAPGEYVAAAVSASTWEELQKPGQLAYLLGKAHKLMLGQRTTQNVELRLTESW